MALRSLSQRARGEPLEADIALELVEYAAAERRALREPEALLELRPTLPLTRALGRRLRTRIYGEDGFVRLSLRSIPGAYRRYAYAAIAMEVGEPLLRYDFQFEVADRGVSHLDSAVPVSMTRAATGMHTDSSAFDCVPGIVGLLCERPSLDGGTSRLADAEAACRALAAESPEVLERLRRPFIRDIVTPGLDKGLDSLRRNRIPVVRTEPEFQFRYMRYWIEKGHERAGEPLLPLDLQAFDALDAVLDRPALGAAFRLERGEALFVDNTRFTHSRDAYDAVPREGRLLWRMWLDERVLAAPASPPVEIDGAQA